MTDVKSTLKKALEAGGSMVGELITMAENLDSVYLQDPWRNVVELLPCSLVSYFTLLGALASR